MFLSWSRSRETGWSRTVNVHPSFSSWSSSRFCGSLRGFWSGPMDRYTGRQHTHTHTHTHYEQALKLLYRLDLGPGQAESSAIPSCFSWSSWSAGIRRTGTDRRLWASCFLVMNRRKTTWDFCIVSQLRAQIMSEAVHTCEHQLPFMQQTPVGDEILQSDGLQEMLQTLIGKITFSPFGT